MFKKSIDSDLIDFLQIIVQKSKGYVKNERDAALLLFDVLSNKYNIKKY